MLQAGDKAIYAAGLAILFTVFGLAGCGSSSEAETLTKPEFVKQANKICGSAQSERVEALEKALKGDPNPKPQREEELVTDVILPTIQQMTEELGELGPPKGDEKEVQAIVSAFEGGVQKVEENAGADLTKDVAEFNHANELAEEYGLTGCRV
jgi:hypothetical protein